LEIVVAVIFDLDPSAFFAVMNRHVRGEMLLQPILQFLNRCRCVCLASRSLSST
jgi:hypothetical protein